MLDYLFNIHKYENHWTGLVTRFFIVGTLFAALFLAYQTDAQAQKNVAKTTDERKFEMEKTSTVTEWTCENKVAIRTAMSGDHYLLLWDKKLFDLSPSDSLSGVFKYKDLKSHLDWLIIPSKAMLFDSQKGQRLVDYCKSSEITQSATVSEDLMK